MNTHLIKTVSVGNDFEQAMNDLIESKINNRPTKQRFKVSDLKEQIEELKKIIRLRDAESFGEQTLLKQLKNTLESLNVSDYVSKEDFEAIAITLGSVLKKQESDYVKKEDVEKSKKLLQDKHDNFIGNFKTPTTKATAYGFKAGLLWAIDNMENLVK